MCRTLYSYVTKKCDEGGEEIGCGMEHNAGKIIRPARNKADLGCYIT